MVENSQDDGIDRGEIRTVFSAKHSDIQATGVKMCAEHKWRKHSENEIACTICPTVLIVQFDDERLVNIS